MRQYDHLFFDLDNTLWDFTTNSRLAMFEMLKQTHLLSQLPDFDFFFALYKNINTKLWNEYHHKKITKQKLIIERFLQSFSQFGITDLDWEEINQLYLEKMALQTNLFKGTINTLELLKAKEYKLYIITNGFREVQYKKLSNCNLDKYFTKVFISEEIQCTKPHREIFEHALKSTNARKKRSIMIGDSWDIDIIGALNFGIDQVMFLDNHKNIVPINFKIQNNTTHTPFLLQKKGTRTYFIQELEELQNFL